MKNKKVSEAREDSSVLKAAERLGEAIGTIEKKLIPSVKETLDASRKEIQKFTDGNLRAFNRGYSRAKKKHKR